MEKLLPNVTPIGNSTSVIEGRNVSTGAISEKLLIPPGEPHLITEAPVNGNPQVQIIAIAEGQQFSVNQIFYNVNLTPGQSRYATSQNVDGGVQVGNTRVVVPDRANRSVSVQGERIQSVDTIPELQAGHIVLHPGSVVWMNKQSVPLTRLMVLSDTADSDGSFGRVCFEQDPDGAYYLVAESRLPAFRGARHRIPVNIGTYVVNYPQGEATGVNNLPVDGADPEQFFVTITRSGVLVGSVRQSGDEVANTQTSPRRTRIMVREERDAIFSGISPPRQDYRPTTRLEVKSQDTVISPPELREATPRVERIVDRPLLLAFNRTSVVPGGSVLIIPTGEEVAEVQRKKLLWGPGVERVAGTGLHIVNGMGFSVGESTFFEEKAEHELILGREIVSSISLPSNPDLISRRHVRLVGQGDGTIMVMPLETVNGTSIAEIPFALQGVNSLLQGAVVCINKASELYLEIEGITYPVYFSDGVALINTPDNTVLPITKGAMLKKAGHPIQNSGEKVIVGEKETITNLSAATIYYAGKSRLVVRNNGTDGSVRVIAG